MTSDISGRSVHAPVQPSSAHRGSRARSGLVAAVALVALLAAGLALGAAPAQAATNGSMVTLGDSVASGMHCSCTPFPQQYAAQVARSTGHPVTMRNLAFPGATSVDVLSQVGQSSVQSTVRSSATALVMIGANDFEYAFQGVLAHQRRAWVAFPRVARRVQANVTTIVQTLQRLHPGIRVVVADYWNVMRDGKVGLRTYGAWGESKAVQATTYANQGLARAASATGATLVSTYTAFKGSRGTGDPTALLASDGDHPNARGHALIASVFLAAARLG